MRARGVDARLARDPRVERLLIAYASDFAFLEAALLPHGIRGLLDPRLMTVVSLDHTVWFHGRGGREGLAQGEGGGEEDGEGKGEGGGASEGCSACREGDSSDGWWLYSCDTSWSGNGRGLVHGKVFARDDGTLLASTAQEGLIRVLHPGVMGAKDAAVADAGDDDVCRGVGKQSALVTSRL